MSVRCRALSHHGSSLHVGRPLKCFFCPECGTRIYHQPSYAPVVNIRAGTLDDTSSLEPNMHTWTSSKQPWVTIPEGVTTHEKQP